MIQRIQTIYLLLAVVLLAIAFLFDGIWTGAAAAEYAWFVPVTMGLLGLAAAGGVTAVFLYKDQPRQRGFVVLLQYLTLLGLALLIGANSLAGGWGSLTANASFSTWASVGAPIIAYLMFLMARRGIDKDIKLIKSMDRLR
ncbi:MAG: DUF4293 family protein [Bacteroidetes bacterium]|nr:DUF4293 family protein [Bacteroidota bacterium]MDA1333615.1 DUF4293 family protein [Bacteroidota bacterium]